MPSIAEKLHKDGQVVSRTHCLPLAAVLAMANASRLDYLEQVATIQRMITNREILPVKPGKKGSTNGRKPPLALFYHVPERKPDYGNQFDDELAGLHPLINTKYYRDNLFEYASDRPKVLLLDFALKHGDFTVNMTLNERSFDIFLKEKFLAAAPGKILGRCGGIDKLRDLACHDVVQKCQYWPFDGEIGYGMLVVENKDTYASLCECWGSGQRVFFGHPITTIVYGGGQEAFSTLPPIIDRAVGSEDIWYWGDFDWAGLRIFEKLAESCQAKPLREAYLLMFAKSARMVAERHKAGLNVSLPSMKAGQREVKCPIFWAAFTGQEIEDMLAVLRRGEYIPQECLNATDFKEG